MQRGQHLQFVILKSSWLKIKPKVVPLGTCPAEHGLALDSSNDDQCLCHIHVSQHAAQIPSRRLTLAPGPAEASKAPRGTREMLRWEEL